MAETWFKLEMMNGISSLKRLPLMQKPTTAEGTKNTSEAFCEAIWPGIKWDVNLDTPRIRECFRKLIAGHRSGLLGRDMEFAKRQFPLPSDFAAVLLPRETPKALPAPKGKRDQKKFKTVMDLLNGKIKAPLSPMETETLIKSSNGPEPRVIAIRNKQRAALDWPLLDASGVEIDESEKKLRTGNA